MTHGGPTLHLLEATEGGVARFVVDAAARVGPSRVIALRWRYGTAKLRARLEAAGVPFEEMPLWRAVISLRFWRTVRACPTVFAHSGIAGVVGRFGALARIVSPKRVVYVPHASIGYTSAFGRAIERSLTKLTPAVKMLFVSEGEREDFVERFGDITPERAFVVGLFSESTPMDIGSDPPPPLNLVSVGRIAKQKEPFAVAALLNELARKELAFRFTWIGDGPLRAAFLQALDTSAAGHVEVTGWVDDVTSVLRSIRPHFVVVLSAYEGSSYSILEALSLGIPAVVSEIPANRHLVSDGVSGFVAGGDVVDRLSGSLSDGSYPALRAGAVAAAARFTAAGFDQGVAGVVAAAGN